MFKISIDNLLLRLRNQIKTTKSQRKCLFIFIRRDNLKWRVIMNFCECL